MHIYASYLVISLNVYKSNHFKYFIIYSVVITPVVYFVDSLPFQNNMIMQDKLEKEKADSKNAVEEYVYDMRDKLSTNLEQYASEKVRIKINDNGDAEKRNGYAYAHWWTTNVTNVELFPSLPVSLHVILIYSCVPVKMGRFAIN